jgi:hypothetical protein
MAQLSLNATSRPVHVSTLRSYFDYILLSLTAPEMGLKKTEDLEGS